MTDSKRDDLDKILQYWMDDDPKLNVNAYINIMNWHKAEQGKLIDRILAILKPKPKVDSMCEQYYHERTGYNEAMYYATEAIEKLRRKA